MARAITLSLFAGLVLAGGSQDQHSSTSDYPLEVTPTAADSTNCTITAAQPIYYYWTPLTFSTTIVAATVVEIVNTALHTTRTTTIFNKLPSGYTLPPTNAAGTQTKTISYLRHGTNTSTVLAFPTQFTSWGDAYTWSGTLQITTAGWDTHITAPTHSSTVLFQSFPQQPVIAIPKALADIPDPGGLLFKPTSGKLVWQDYVTAFKDQVPVQKCKGPNFPLPLAADLTARFTTVTSTSYEGSPGSTTPILPPAFPQSISLSKKSSTQPKTSSNPPKSSSATPKTSSITPKISSITPKISSTPPKTSSATPKTSSTHPKISSTSPPKTSSTPATKLPSSIPSAKAVTSSKPVSSSPLPSKAPSSASSKPATVQTTNDSNPTGRHEILMAFTLAATCFVLTI